MIKYYHQGVNLLQVMKMEEPYQDRLFFLLVAAVIIIFIGLVADRVARG